MAQRSKPDTDKAPLKPQTRIVMQSPVTVELVDSGKKKNRKRTSSRGTRRLTDIDRRVSKALRRITRAADHGIDTYIDHRDKSEEKRRDGVVVDFAENVSYGMSQAISEASPVLHDVTEAFNTRRVRKQIRRIARGFRAIPLFG
jgi:hypothetical protein